MDLSKSLAVLRNGAFAESVQVLLNDQDALVKHLKGVALGDHVGHVCIAKGVRQPLPFAPRQESPKSLPAYALNLQSPLKVC